MLLQGMRLQGVSLRACVVNGRTAAKGLRLQSVFRFKTNAALGNVLAGHILVFLHNPSSLHTHTKTHPCLAASSCSLPGRHTVPYRQTAQTHPPRVCRVSRCFQLESYPVHIPFRFQTRSSLTVISLGSSGSGSGVSSVVPSRADVPFSGFPGSQRSCILRDCAQVNIIIVLLNILYYIYRYIYNILEFRVSQFFSVSFGYFSHTFFAGHP